MDDSALCGLATSEWQAAVWWMVMTLTAFKKWKTENLRIITNVAIGTFFYRQRMFMYHAWYAFYSYEWDNTVNNQCNVETLGRYNISFPAVGWPNTVGGASPTSQVIALTHGVFRNMARDVWPTLTDTATHQGDIDTSSRYIGNCTVTDEWRLKQIV